MKNRFMLAPLTNMQSHADGQLSDDEFKWLTLRAAGGFGLIMTCAAHVQAIGQAFPGQLGVFGDHHIPGLARLASAIKANGSVAALQLHHGGNRAARELVGQPVCPSEHPESGSRGLSLLEVDQLVEDFVAAAARADTAGFDGIELHGAHGYILAQFLSSQFNHRTDRYGGSIENRSRIIFEVIEGIRSRCRPDFQIGLRLSPERFGNLRETREVARSVLAHGHIDYLDVSLWDVLKEPSEPGFEGRSLMSYFTELDRGDVRLGVSGKIMTSATAAQMVNTGADFVLIGRAAILHHDFPQRARDPAFASVPLPVNSQYLADEGLAPPFINYLSTAWDGFVEASQ